MDAAGDPWGLDRIDQISLPASRTYSYNGRGANARAFVIDTGVDDTHPEFRLPTGASRAARSFDVFGGNGADCNGHGTHVAGTVAGTTYGVAKLAQVRGVRVLDCGGSGTIAGVIAGVDWVRANRGNGRAVANLSLSGGRSEALNAAVERLVASGVFVAVAAGNDPATPSCSLSPASARSAWTAAASDNADRSAVFTSSGACVDGYAPGDGILSSVPGGGSARLSGTSMASPHVAGIGALLKGYANFSPSFITSWIDLFSIPGAIAAAPPGTDNSLVHKSEL
jgi:subtilisin family serine protease